MDEVEDTLLHEVAHVLAGPGHGHNRIWKSWARKVGARPDRCGYVDESHMPGHKWELVCRGCGEVVARRHRRTNMSHKFHTPCGSVDGRVFYRRALT